MDEKNRDGYTPLHLSCDYETSERRQIGLDCDHLKIAALLLDRGSTAIDEQNGDGYTPLHVACRGGYLEIARRFFMDRGSTAIDEKSRDSQTPLHLACENGRLEIATLLLDRGSTAIDEKGSAGSRPLVPALSPMGWRAVLRSGRAQTVAKTPEQREQARAAQVAHPAASTSAHDPPRLRPCVWSCELVRRRVWSSKANRKGTHAAASCAWVSITQVVTCLHPRVLCGSGEGHVFKIYLAPRLMRRMMMT